MIDYAKCCQWVDGEPTGERTVFCSEPVTAIGSSWCTHHYIRVFRRGYIPLGRNVEMESENE
jgi:hypothetical protein